MSKREQYVIVLGVLAALGFLAWGAKKAPGGAVKVPAAATENVAVFIPPPGAPMMHMADHVGPYGLVYTPHRYPAACGSEISVLIHRGYHTMMLPHEKDMTWLSIPPGEAEL